MSRDDSSSAVNDAVHVIDHFSHTSTTFFEKYLFGLYFFSQIKISSSVAIISMLLHFLQLLAFVFSDTGVWASTDIPRTLDTLRDFRLFFPLADTSFRTYFAVFVLLSLLALGIIIFSGYLAMKWRDEAFPTPSALTCLRWGTMILGRFLFVSTLGLSLSMLDCTSSAMSLFPDRQCWGSTHIVLSVFAVASAVCVILVAMKSVLVHVSATAVSPNLFAGARVTPHLLQVGCETLLTVGAIALHSDSIAWFLLQFVCFGLMFRTSVWHLVYYKPWVNKLQSGFHAILFQASSVALVGKIIALGWEADEVLTSETKSTLTIMVLALMPFSFLLGCGGAHLRLRLLDGTRSFRRVSQVDGSIEKNAEFPLASVEETEIAIRFIYSVPSPSSEKIELAESILYAGRSQYPKSVWLQVLYCSFLSEVQHNFGRADILIRESRGRPSSLMSRYFLALRDRFNKERRLQSADPDSLEDAVTLTTLYQKAQSSLQKFEHCQRSFYKALASRHVQPRILQKLVQTIHKVRTELDGTMLRLLKSNGRSVSVLRLYGRYLSIVKKELRTGAAFFAEASVLEAESQETRRLQSLFNPNLSRMDNEVDRVVTINRIGTMVRVTMRAARMFGYQTAEELLGQNCRILAPPPHGVNHDEYLKRSQEGTQNMRMLNKERIVLGQHVNGSMFPLKIYMFNVSTGSSGGEAFVARLEPFSKLDVVPDEISKQPPTFATNAGGEIVSFNRNFLEAMKASPSDIFKSSIFEMIGNRNGVASIYDFPSATNFGTALAFRDVLLPSVSLSLQLIGNQKNRMLLCTFVDAPQQIQNPSMRPADRLNSWNSPRSSFSGSRGQSQMSCVSPAILDVGADIVSHSDPSSSDSDLDLDQNFGRGSVTIPGTVPNTELTRAANSVTVVIDSASAAAVDLPMWSHLSLENTLHFLPDDEAAALEDLGIKDDLDYAIGVGDQFQSLGQFESIVHALSIDTVMIIMRRSFRWIRLCLIVSLVIHFCVFGGLWARLALRYEFEDPGSETAAVSLPSAESFQIVNLSELTKHLNFLFLYARIARSGTPHAFSGSALEGMQSNALQARFHATNIQEMDSGRELIDMSLEVRDISASGDITTRTSTAWNAIQEVLTSALGLTNMTATQEVAPREWMYIMMNGPTVVHKTLDDCIFRYSDKATRSWQQMLGLICVAFIIEALILVGMVGWGMGPISEAVKNFKIMLMRVYLSIPRSSAKKLSKQVEDISDAANMAGTMSKTRQKTGRISATSPGFGVRNRQLPAMDLPEIPDFEADSDDSNVEGAPSLAATVSRSFTNHLRGEFSSRLARTLQCLRTAVYSAFLKMQSSWRASKATEISILRGRETIRFKADFEHRFSIALAAFFMLLWVSGTYAIFLSMTTTNEHSSLILANTFIIRYTDNHLRFLLHEMSGGWTLYPNLWVMQQSSLQNVEDAMATILGMDLSTGNLQQSLFVQECFQATPCEGPALAKGLFGYQTHWNWMISRFVETLALRNSMSSVSGSATTFLPKTNFGNSDWVIFEGFDILEFGLAIVSAEQSVVGGSVLVMAMHVLFLIAACFQVFLREVLFRRLLKAHKIELEEGAHILAMVPEYIGISDICDRERKRAFPEVV